jgi:hypothetical protein
LRQPREVTADRCPSCGKQVGDIVRTRYEGNVTILHVEIEAEDGQLVEVEHVCGDRPTPG